MQAYASPRPVHAYSRPAQLGFLKSLFCRHMHVCVYAPPRPLITTHMKWSINIFSKTGDATFWYFYTVAAVDLAYGCSLSNKVHLHLN